MKSLITYFSSMPKVWSLAWAAALAALIGVLDYYTGLKLRLFPLYFLPIGLVSLTHSRRYGVLGAAVITAFWAVANYDPTHPLIFVGNILSQLSAFVIVALLIHHERNRADEQEEIATIDSLTGLLNSRAYYASLERALAEQKLHVTPLTLAYLDVDDFKKVNSALGHLGADDVLVRIAQTMRSTLRASDTIARVGGDEFSVLLPRTSKDHAHDILERLRKAVLEATRAQQHPISVSVGAIVFEEPAESSQEMLRLSDEAMYAAKERSKNTVVIHNRTSLVPPG